MQKNKIFIATALAVLLFFLIPIQFVQANNSASVLIKKGMSGPEVLELQKNLKTLGFFNENPTGFFGSITEFSVINFQKKYGLLVDGIVGNQTYSQINSILLREASTTSRSDNRDQSTNNINMTLKVGITNDEVKKLQEDLKLLGFFSIEPTGYFGEITKSAVINFQKKYNLLADGVAGPKTLSAISSILSRTQNVSRSGIRKEDIQLLPWYGKVENILSIGTVATAIDVDTGLSFKFKRTYGYNHADVETLTAQDTEILKKIAGGYWNWTRRAIIVEVNGYRIAASLTAMPHAGRDDKPANIIVDGRSGGYGTGTNLDSVKGNKMDGHFDIHFYQSRTHATNKVDEAHQAMVQKAYKSGL